MCLSNVYCTHSFLILFKASFLDFDPKKQGQVLQPLSIMTTNKLRLKDKNPDGIVESMVERIGKLMCVKIPNFSCFDFAYIP